MRAIASPTMRFQLLQTLYCGLLISIAWQPNLLAQITPDSTLPRSSRVTRDGNQFEITGGTQAGSNLFHSFDRFSVPSGGSAAFRNVDSDVDNIFTRVTGSNISRIDGLIEVLETNGGVSDANFFLLNPNGIIFGENAALNIGGSFLATTADRINFADNTQFSSNPSSTNLLTVSVPIGLQFGSNSGSITNHSIQALVDDRGNPISDPVGNPTYGLRVPDGQTLALVGGDVFSEGWLSTAGGRVEIGSVGQGDRVRLSLNSSGIELGYEAAENFGEIRLIDGSLIDVSGAGGGSIQIRGDRVFLLDGATIFAHTYGDRNGAGIAINASHLTLDHSASIESNSYGVGNGGNINARIDRLFIDNNSFISTNTLASGRGGNLAVTAADSIELIGAVEIDGEIRSSGLFALVGREATETSQGGNLLINTPQLSIRSGARIAIDTFGAGDARTMTIRASDIEIAGIGRDRTGEPFLFNRVPAAPSSLSAFADAGSQGRGGSIDIATQRLTLRDGATIQASTQSSSDAGAIRIAAIDRLEVSGTVAELGVPTGLLTFSGGIPGTNFGFGDRVTGAGGDLSINAGSLIVRDGAVVAVGSLNPNPDAGRSGNLRITTNFLLLDDRASLLANTNSGNGGNVDLRVQDAIVLRRNSAISSTAGIAGRGGNGGNIQIASDFLVSALGENSDITANAFTGDGGNITIDRANILGILPQDNQTPQSDITASSRFGNSGQITITNPNVDPSQGLVELPANLIDAANQIAQSCSSGATAQQPNEFVITGRGGLPASPIDRRGSEIILSQWASIAPNSAISPIEPLDPPAAIVEAQGWTVGENGEVLLIAERPTAVRSIAATPTECNSGRR